MRRFFVWSIDGGNNSNMLTDEYMSILILSTVLRRYRVGGIKRDRVPLRICQDSAHYLKLVPNSAVHSGAFVLGVPVLDAISTA